MEEVMDIFCNYQWYAEQQIRHAMQYEII